MKLRMNVSFASTNGFSAQPGDIVEVNTDLAKQWIRSGHGTRVSDSTPLRSVDDPLIDLSMEEALRHRCSSCDAQRASRVIGNRPFCARCYRANFSR